MKAVTSISILLSLASFLTPTFSRQTPTSYCKCICFQNSTIIPLNSPPEQKPPTTDDPSNDFSDSKRRTVASYNTEFDITDRSAGSFNLGFEPQLTQRDDGDEDAQNGENGSGNNEHHRTLTCSDCNRAFCLDYNLPICKGAKEEDVFTSCFQRDSVKDETVVLLFILLTASLLGWAVLKPWIDKFRATGSAAAYVPVTLGGSGAGDRGSARGGLQSNLMPRPGQSYRDEGAGSRDRGDSGSIARQGGLNS